MDFLLPSVMIQSRDVITKLEYFDEIVNPNLKVWYSTLCQNSRRASCSFINLALEKKSSTSSPPPKEWSGLK